MVSINGMAASKGTLQGLRKGKTGKAIGKLERRAKARPAGFVRKEAQPHGKL